MGQRSIGVMGLDGRRQPVRRRSVDSFSHTIDRTGTPPSPPPGCRGRHVVRSERWEEGGSRSQRSRARARGPPPRRVPRVRRRRHLCPAPTRLRRRRARHAPRSRTSKSKRRSTSASTTVASIIANWSPTHLRAPPPNGRNAKSDAISFFESKKAGRARHDYVSVVRGGHSWIRMRRVRMKARSARSARADNSSGSRLVTSSDDVSVVRGGTPPDAPPRHRSTSFE